jgi:hypothetical protein
MERTVFPPMATAMASASRTRPLSVYCPFGRVSSLLQIPARQGSEISHRLELPKDDGTSV